MLTRVASAGSVAFNKLKEHELVKTGIYAWSRHPSYAGFVWWALGTQVSTQDCERPATEPVLTLVILQVMLANPFGFVAFAVVLYSFFSHRIKG